MRISPLACVVATAACSFACSDDGPPSNPGASIEVTGSGAPDDEANAPEQKPAFPEQTRAKAPAKPRR